jgi:hypothetical protein
MLALSSNERLIVGDTQRAATPFGGMVGKYPGSPVRLNFAEELPLPALRCLICIGSLIETIKTVLPINET